MAGYDSASGTFSNKGFLTVADMTAFRADMLAAITQAGALDHSTLPASAQQLPLAFVMPGKPAAGAVLNLVLATPVALPANLAGTQGYAGTGPSPESDAAGGTFVIKKIAAADGVATTLGTAGFAPGANRATASLQGTASLEPGDVLQLAAPSAPDPALADVCITILATRV